jgi:hypothetical protein
VAQKRKQRPTVRREQFRLDDEHDHRPYRVSEVRKERGDGGADTPGGLNI